MPDRIQSAARASFAPDIALRLLKELWEKTSQSAADFSACSASFLASLSNMLIISPPMLQALLSHPEWLGWLSARMEGGNNRSNLAQEYEFSRKAWLEEHGEASSILDLLRAFKRREYLAVAFEDISGSGSFQDTVRRISALAELVIRLALDYCWHDVSETAPVDLKGSASADGFAVIALGKLGGNELNYSSDVDLVFCRRASDDEGERRFFTRLGERLIQALSQNGPDGFLFRVDMRLRPHGETGPLVPTFPSIISYYESWGEAWERQALIKARPVAGSVELGRRFTEFATRFTFARQMDDSALEEIKRVKHRAEKEYALSDDRIHIKQGAGGIRDIEFYVQYLQLIAGWAHPEVRGPSTLGALDGLGSAKLLIEGELSTLSIAYTFLRTIEHRLQLRALTPQAVVPKDDSEAAMLARGLGFGEEDAIARARFHSALKRYRSRVRAILERIYLTPGYLRLTEREEEFARLLSERTPKERVRELLAQYRFRDIDKAWQNIRLMALGPAGELLPPRERRFFLEFAYPMLEVLRDSIDPDLALHHLESFAAASGNRISFLRALASRRPHLSRLTNLLALSNLSHQILLRHPEYFDSLARGIYLHEGRHWEDMHKEIRDRIGASPRGESPSAVLRKFQQREIIRVAYRDLAGLADPIEISSELSGLSQACIQTALDITRPANLDFSRDYCEQLQVLGLGKLGSRCMHYASDLDLMFIYDTPAADSGPEKRARLQLQYDERVERIVELLSAVTSEGVVYDLDLRLRPEGATGLLARSWESFMEYARRHIEPWERLALVRSRVIGGRREMAERWDEVLSEIVFEFRWNEEMFEALRHLKRRIETEKNKESRISLDFKYGKGGVVDLEFLVQWLQIQYGGNSRSARTPFLSAAIPALQASGALSTTECDTLGKAHRFQRLLENRYQLMEEWNSREISRESPALARLARSVGYPESASMSARKALIADWEDHARAVRSLVETYVFRS